MIKKILSTIIAVILIGSCVVISSCKGDEPSLTQQQKVTKLLTDNGGTWTLPSTAGVVVDGLDVTSDLFQGFSITFGDGTLTTTGTSPVWLRNDTWSFKDETATVIIRGQDNKEVTIKEITKDNLVLSLDWDQETYAPDGGRTRSIKGTYEFVLTK